MRRTLFPKVEPYNHFFFRVSDIHELYVEEVGNPNGQPVVFLHGGPGAGLSTQHRRFFDPQHYRIILFDQRGAGKSRPHASLEHNTTWDLVADIEKIRTYLKIDKWMVFGGSWGSTLGLVYAETHPQFVTSLVLRGIFMVRKEEIHWFYQCGANFIYPDLWEAYLKPIAKEDQADLVRAYYKELTHADELRRLTAARAWSTWEGSTLKLIPEQEAIASFTTDHISLSLARVECHFFMNHGFFKSDDQLLTNVEKIRHIPTVIIHGRYDVVCPVKNAWDLHKVFPEAELHIIQDAGHAADEPGIIDALVTATEKFKNLK